MKNLIYDFYGIYVDEIKGHHFVYLGQDYYIYDCPFDENQLLKQYMFYEMMFARIQYYPYMQLVKNRYHHYISSSKVLFLKNKLDISLDVLIKSSFVSMQIGRYEDILSNWIRQMDMVENQALPAIMGHLSKFEYLYALTAYYLGMAENALAYLQDYFNSKMSYSKSFQLIKIGAKEIDGWVNPLYYQFDHYLNFLVRLYRQNYLSIEQMIPYLKQLPATDLIYMYSALLYPEEFFLQITCQSIDNPDTYIRFYKNVEIQEKRIKDFYQVISEMVQIRPLEWLR